MKLRTLLFILLCILIADACLCFRAKAAPLYTIVYDTNHVVKAPTNYPSAPTNKFVFQSNVEISNASLTVNGIAVATTSTVAAITNYLAKTGGVVSGQVTIPTNSLIGTNRIASIADITAGTVTDGQWNASVAIVGLVASGALQRTGGTVTGTVTITGTNLIGHRVAVTGGGDYVPMIGRSDSVFLTGVEYLSGTMIAGFLVATNPAANAPNITIGHDLARNMVGAFQSFAGLADLAGGDSGDFWRLQYAYIGGTTTTLARVTGSTAGGFAPQIIVSNGVFYGDGSGLSNLTSASSVRLTTNLLLVLDSTVGDWFCLRNVSGPTTNNSVTPPVHAGYVTVDSRTFPYARMETALTNTWQTRTVVSRMVDLGEVATNVAAVRIVFPGASASSTQTVSFLGPTSNVFATVTLTNSTNYDLTASLFATNRRWHAQIHGYVPPAVGTNVGWLAMPRGEVIKQ